MSCLAGASLVDSQAHHHDACMRNKTLTVLSDERDPNDDLPCCHFFNGISNRACDAGLLYAEVDLSPSGAWPCTPDKAGDHEHCDQFRVSTPEEIAAREHADREAIRRINAGKSPCCKAKLRPVGGGWQVCSSCNDRVVHFYQTHEQRIAEASRRFAEANPHDDDLPVFYLDHG
jgi:hypothetical protein